VTTPPKDINTKTPLLAQKKQQMALGVWDVYLETNCEQVYRKSTGFIHTRSYRAKETAAVICHIFTEVSSGRHSQFCQWSPGYQSFPGLGKVAIRRGLRRKGEQQ